MAPKLVLQQIKYFEIYNSVLYNSLGICIYPFKGNMNWLKQEPEKRNICLVALTSYIKYVSAFFNVINNGFD